MTTYAFNIYDVPTDENGFFMAMPTEKCSNAADETVTCEGPAEVRYSRSGMTATIRCEGCQDRHDEVLDGIARRYPDSPTPPSWFDPTYAGESWDEDY